MVNLFSSAKSPILQNSVKTAMVAYATFVQKTFTPVVSPNSGYKAYDKQMALAKQVIQNPDLYTEAASRLILTNEPDIEFRSGDVIGYLFKDNPTSTNVFGCIAYNENNPGAGWSISSSPGDTIWDALAGVNQGDYV